MKFTKWQGLGNDFIIPGEVDLQVDDLSSLAVKLCDRNFGIGADGLCLLETSAIADMRMRLINSDGSEAEMCGNLIRCVARYLYERGLCRKLDMSIETLAGIMKPQLILKGDAVDKVKVAMSVPQLKRAQIPVVGEPDEDAMCIEVAVAGTSYQGTCISMGNPHFVTFVENIDSVPICAHGPLLEKNELFPKKINVEFVQILHPGKVRMRVWERGAGITLACGTGACATVAAGILHGFLSAQVEVMLDGGSLLIEWPDQTGPIYMTGPAQEVFSGIINL